jgi:hypothetical protein
MISDKLIRNAMSSNRQSSSAMLSTYTKKNGSTGLSKKGVSKAVEENELKIEELTVNSLDSSAKDA